jgi:hypothetical protein
VVNPRIATENIDMMFLGCLMYCNMGCACFLLDLYCRNTTPAKAKKVSQGLTKSPQAGTAAAAAAAAVDTVVEEKVQKSAGTALLPAREKGAAAAAAVQEESGAVDESTYADVESSKNRTRAGGASGTGRPGEAATVDKGTNASRPKRHAASRAVAVDAARVADQVGLKAAAAKKRRAGR